MKINERCTLTMLELSHEGFQKQVWPNGPDNRFIQDHFNTQTGLVTNRKTREE